LGIKSYGSAEAAMTLPLSAFRTRTLVDCVPLSMPIRSVRIKSSRLNGGQNGDRERRCPIRTEGSVVIQSGGQLIRGARVCDACDPQRLLRNGRIARARRRAAARRAKGWCKETQ